MFEAQNGNLYLKQDTSITDLNNLVKEGYYWLNLSTINNSPFNGTGYVHVKTINGTPIQKAVGVSSGDIANRVKYDSGWTPWAQVAIKSDFVKYTISGTTDGYGQIQNPKSEYIPIAAASGYFAISSDGNVVRVVNVAQSNIELLKNEEVNFIVIAIKKSALTNI